MANCTVQQAEILPPTSEREGGTCLGGEVTETRVLNTCAASSSVS